MLQASSTDDGKWFSRHSRRFSHRAGNRHVQFHKCRLNGNLVDRQLMKRKIHSRVGALSSITYDRCGQTWQADTVDAAEFTSIDFACGYTSIFGDGSQVKPDSYQRCLKTTLGLWLRVSDRDRQEHALPRDFDAFDSGAKQSNCRSVCRYLTELETCSLSRRSNLPQSGWLSHPV